MSFYDNRTVLPFIYYAGQYNNQRRARVIVIECCMKKWKPFTELPGELQAQYIRRIERSCYNHACTIADERNVPLNWHNDMFKSLYNITTYKIQKNLLWSADDPGSEYLISRVVSGEVDVNNIGSMESRDMRPEKSQDIYDDIENRKKQTLFRKFSTQHECFKCGGNKTTEVEIQLRSLDEGSTVIITCEMDNCTNVWRISS